MKKVKLLLIFLITVIISCKNNSKNNEMNPLLDPNSRNEYGIIDFKKIKHEHYLPAIKEAMAEQMKIINEIAESKEDPNFQNTIEAYEYSGLKLHEIESIFYALLSANTDDEMQKIAQELASIETKHYSNIIFNKKLFEKIKKVYNNRENLNLTTEQKTLLEKIYKSFVRAGALLSPELQDSLRVINEKIAQLQLKFDENKLKEINNYLLVIDKKEDLDGLPQHLIDAAAELATEKGMQGKWCFTLHRPVVFGFLQYAKNRDLRQKIYTAYMNIANKNNEYDNKKIISELVNLRIKKAQMLGYKNYAQYVLELSMAQNPENVINFLNSIWEKALKVAKKEANLLQQYIYKEGKNFKLQPWDWFYYAEKVRKDKYNLDENEIKPYFEINNVLNGLFYVVNKLYNIKIEELADAPTYLDEVKAYKVIDLSNNSLLGIVYFDYFPRASKQSGAWMTEFRGQYIYQGKDYRPIISTCYNFTKPSSNNPTLLTLEEVQTLYHEFGHTLHALLSKCTYPSLSGTSVYRDFVELPSQIHENWALEPEVLKVYAKHYKTGEPIPDNLIEKIVNSQKFNQGFATVEYLAASLLDMNYHILEKPFTVSPLEFEEQIMKKINMPNEIISRYRSTYFSHIFGGDYASGYYSYIWAEVLDADAFEIFKKSGNIFNPDISKSFKENILSKGGTEHPMNLYKKFSGREPQIEPLLKRRGLI